ncbi:hypothetical protein KPH14_001031 [Odynerus spinipes]|uniref:Pre-C2HC domain-containing protein n=1 Tax=Odynerus spinipes TaxID=1348599 RepID=A0AAD9REH7_9HYME|nr:hypothetical protein KPH14_001031 [Odynerus spinipes]
MDTHFDSQHINSLIPLQNQLLTRQDNIVGSSGQNITLQSYHQHNLYFQPGTSQVTSVQTQQHNVPEPAPNNNRTNEWTIVNNKKRPWHSSDSDTTSTNVEKRSYWLSTSVETPNRFQPLNTVNNSTYNSISYTKIAKELEAKDTQFYTFQYKSQRNFKVVLRGLHPSSNLDEIKSEIETNGHKVVRITNIRNNSTKSPTPLFFVELKPQENNKLIYDLKHLLQTIVTVEKPYKKRIYHNVQGAKHMDTPKITARVFLNVSSVQINI